MPTVNALHIKAMDFAENAFLHQRKGENETANRLFKLALELEQQAASMLDVKPENEPSRSILYRSAASLAYNCRDYDTAEKLVAQGLLGFPPPEIGDELRDIFDEVTFERHLSIKGMELSDSEWKMTLTGAAIAKGIAQAEQLLTRFEKVSTLVRRTVERKLQLPFQINRSIPDEREERYGLFVKALIPSSFAVVFRLGRPDQQLSLLPGDVEPKDVVDELLHCLEDVQNDQIERLKDRIGDSDYFDNFIGLAKQIAPDGKEVKAVGFTILRDGKEKPLLIRKTRQEIKESISKTLPLKDREEIENVILEGVLTYANTPSGKKYGKVKLRMEEGKGQKEINVPIGLMKDVVQPYYDENVKVSVVFKNGKYFLDDIIR